MSVGITLDGTVTGIELLSISETAGLGMNAQEPEFKEQFQDVNTDHFEVVKGDGGKEGKIDALSGSDDHNRCGYQCGQCRSCLLSWSNGRRKCQ